MNEMYMCLWAVWQKLEEQNPDFFKAYYTRLKVKDQIELFNTMLEYHAQVLQKTRAGVGTAAGVSGAAPMAVPAANLMHGPPHMQNGHGTRRAPYSVLFFLPPGKSMFLRMYLFSC